MRESIKLDISVFLACILCPWAINPFIFLVYVSVLSDIPLHAIEEISTVMLTLVHLLSTLVIAAAT